MPAPMTRRQEALEESLQRWARADFDNIDPNRWLEIEEISKLGVSSQRILSEIYIAKQPHAVIAKDLNTNVHSLRHRLRWIRQEIIERADARQTTTSRIISQQW
jgi:hypothetical protein